MGIQWFPGHMAKARRLIAESLSIHDVVIEVLDARMPLASANPIVTELRAHKPCLKVLTKSDLADPKVTKEWLRYFEASTPAPTKQQRGEVIAIAVTTTRPADIKALIPDLCKRLAKRPPGKGRTVRTMVLGIPNVGKSTLINTLVARKVTRVGDEPGVTKGQQQVVREGGMTLLDNPGILWPNVDDEDTSLRLALGGAVPDVAFDYELVALFGVRHFLAHYPAMLKARYKIDALPTTPEAALAEIGRKRGAMRSGGVIDMHKAADIVVHDFRSGVLGRISLESPPPSPAPRASLEDDS